MAHTDSNIVEIVTFPSLIEWRLNSNDFLINYPSEIFFKDKEGNIIQEADIPELPEQDVFPVTACMKVPK